MLNEKRIISPNITLREALSRLNKDDLGILLACDDKRRLLGVLTDGDFRKALIQGYGMNTPCHQVMNRYPVTLAEGIERKEALEIMNGAAGGPYIFFIPVIDDNNVVKDVLERAEIEEKEEIPVHAVIMAGGFGTRLAPITDDMPKPMLKIGGKPLLERIVNQLVSFGVKNITMTTHYMADKIMDHFGDGAGFNAHISYIHEEKPLGTAGALSLLSEDEKHILVINGDILSNVNYTALWHYHAQMKSDITVAARQYDIEIPYGVLDTDEEGRVQELQEKPVQKVQINAGIYMLSPKVKKKLKKNEAAQMTDLIDRFKGRKGSVYSFVIHEYWIDIGQHHDYERARREYNKVFNEKVG